MLPLPGADLTAARGHPAKYVDAAAYSQSLFGVLKVVDTDAKVALLEPGVGAYWTEHSERNGLPTWAASYGVHSDHIDRLGRWGARMSEQYVRSTRLIVERLQVGLAAKVRDGKGGTDWIDEEQVLHGISGYMTKHGFNDDVIESQIGRLRYFNKNSGALEAAESGGTAPAREIEDLTQEPRSLADTEKTPPAILDKPDTEEKELPTSGYVITYTFKKRLRRLHYIGRCYRRPGVDYYDYEAHGETLPPPDRYDKTCLQCWPPVGKGPEQAGTDDSDEESSSSSGSSSYTSVGY